MNTRQLKSKLLILCLFAVTSLVYSNAGISLAEYTKEINEEFNISRDGDVKITNKYGNIEINSWSQAKVKIDVTIKVDASSESKANDIFDKINIKFDNGSSYVSAETEFNFEQNWWNWGKDKDGKFSIDYVVYAPASVVVDVTNKYGDLNMSDFNNDANINLKYGNFNVANIDGALEAEIKYCKGKIGNVGNSSINTGYTDLVAKKVGNLELTSKYSDIEIEEAADISSTTKYDDLSFGTVGNFVNNGKYDDIEIGNARSIESNTKYTSINVNNLELNADLEMSYGGVNIGGLSPAFSSFKMVAKHASIDLNVKTNYHLTLQSKYSAVKLPDDLEVYSREKDGNELNIDAYKGSRNEDARIDIEMKYGELRIRN